MTEADRWIEMARAAHDQLVAVVRPLTPEDLARRSACSEWNVAGVLSHLGSGSEIALIQLDAALAGDEPPGPDINQPIWDRWNALDDPARRDGFLESEERLIARYEGIDAETRERFSVNLSYMPAPVDLGTLVSMRLTELVLHSWDVRVAFDDSAALFAPAVGLIVDRIGMYVGFLGRPDALAGRHATIGVRTTDPDGHHTVTVDERVSYLDAAPKQPDATFTIPTEAWIRLVTGRVPERWTPSSVKVDGDAVTLDDLRGLFPGM